MEPQGPEGVVDHQLGRLGAIALAPGVRFADGDVVERRPVVPVELAERAGPDQPVGRPLVDGHRQRVGPDHAGGEEPLDLLRRAWASLVARQPGDLGVRVPALECRDVLRGVPPQGHQFCPVRTSGNQFRRHHLRARYTILAMRRWSELAERLAATTRTSEKTALLADYLRTLTPDELPDRGGLPDRPPFAEADQRAAGLGWSAIATTVTDLAGVPRSALGEAYDRSSDLGIAVADVLAAAGHAPPPGTCPTLPEVAEAFAAIEAGLRGGAEVGHPARPPRALRSADRASTWSRCSAATCGSASARGSSTRPSPRPSTGRSTTSNGPACSSATSVAWRRSRATTRWIERRAGALPPAQVHARLAGRGRRRDHRAPRSRGLGRGQVRRHPGPAPQAGRRGPALLARPARHQLRLPGDRRGGASARLGRHPRRRDPGLARRRSPAVHRAPGPARSEGAVRGDPGRGSGHLRRLRRAGPRSR